jgi:hypothetical protein
MLLLLTLGFLAEPAQRQARLVTDVEPPRAYDTMSRTELQVEWDLLSAKRPGLLAPLALAIPGAVGAVVTAIVFIANFTTIYGLAVYAAVLLTGAFIICLAAVALGVVVYVRNKPERDAIGRELDAIERTYREGRCRSVPGQRPCQNDPNAPAMSPGFAPQVSAPAPTPMLVLASF